MANIMKRSSGSTPTVSGVIDNVFRNGLSRFLDDDFWGYSGLTGMNQVPVNIRDTEKSYEMEVMAPGLKRSDFNLDVSDNMLTISFEHKEDSSEGKEEEGWLRREHRMQSFSRSFTLDDTVDPEKIKAKYTDGVLYVTLPKKEGKQRMSKKIEIS
jgi:HSP20 family protein